MEATEPPGGTQPSEAILSPMAARAVAAVARVPPKSGEMVGGGMWITPHLDSREPVPLLLTRKMGERLAARGTTKLAAPVGLRYGGLVQAVERAAVQAEPLPLAATVGPPSLSPAPPGAVARAVPQTEPE